MFFLLFFSLGSPPPVHEEEILFFFPFQHKTRGGASQPQSTNESESCCQFIYADDFSILSHCCMNNATTSSLSVSIANPLVSRVSCRSDREITSSSSLTTLFFFLLIHIFHPTTTFSSLFFYTRRRAEDRVSSRSDFNSHFGCGALFYGGVGALMLVMHAVVRI